MPTVIICGTPGTGKSTLTNLILSQRPEINLINISEFVKERGCHEGYDEEFGCHIIDDDKLEAELKQVLAINKSQLNLVESISGDIVNSELVDFVFVTRTDNDILYDRLKARNYTENKLRENLESEIFRIVLDDALEHFNPSKVMVLTNNTDADLKTNLESILKHLNNLIK